MEYFDPDYEEQVKKGNKTTKLLIIGIVLVLIIIMVLLYLIMQLSANQFSAFIDGKQINISNDLFIIENGKVYVSIEDIAEPLSYNYHSGEYKDYMENEDKCYVESQDETASFFLNSNKISKVVPGTQDDYENYTISEPVKKINNKMYILSEGIDIAFNVSFNYSQEKNRIDIYTIPYLIQGWSPKIIEAGYELASDTDFNNNKTVLENMFIVKKGSGIGVINIQMKEVVVPKYSKIEYLESTKEFLVTSTTNKVGILLSNGTSSSTKISPQYDEIKILDRESGLYVIKLNGKYGVIDNTGSNVIYPEYDQIGVNTAQFPNDEIENQYVLYDNIIPVKYSDKWGFFDKSGQVIVEPVYNFLGCAAQGNASSGVLLIEEYNAIVVGRDKLYGVINSLGQELIPCALSSVYTTKKSGVLSYYMIYGELTLDVIEYLKQNATNTTNQTENNTQQQQAAQQTEQAAQEQTQQPTQQQQAEHPQTEQFQQEQAVTQEQQQIQQPEQPQEVQQ